ncbi:MAG: hypothetical protein U0350_49165 [Caldilineaceae bacterium]
MKNKDRPYSLERESTLPLPKRIQLLVEEMHTCIENKRSIDLSTPPHREITEALRYLVYEQINPAKLQVTYNDNTHGEPFPVRVLQLPTSGLSWENSSVLNIGSLTFRHVDYDNYVDVYLIRDRETRRLTNQEIETEAYKRMKEILSDQSLQNETYLAIYQTGLEPLIVGIYRALVEHLLYRSEHKLAQLTVQPVFFVESARAATGELWG